MSTLLFQVVEVASVLGALLLAASLILSATRTFRPWAIAVLCGGALGAAFAVGLWVFHGIRLGVGREVTVSDVTAILALAGFGMGAGFGATVRYFVDLLQANARLDGRGPYIP
jgi:hypothetical protein